MHRYFVFVSFSLLLAASGLPLGSAQADITQQLQTLQSKHNIPVLVAAYAKDMGPLQTLTLGGGPNTPLRWGSITKLITALTVLELSRLQDISLNAPAAEYVDNSLWQNPWQATAPIRLIDLLELRAGFPDLSAIEFDHAQPVTLEQAMALNPKHRQALWPPGLQHAYSNLTPGLSQQLIENLSGMSYASAVAKYVFAPFQMNNAGFQPVDTLPGGYRADGHTPIPYWHMTFLAYGALNAPLGDMQQLLDRLRGAKPLPETTRRHLFAPHGRRLATTFNFDYAAGLYPQVKTGRVWHTHGGDADGYRSRIAVLAGTPRGYVVNINTDNPAALRAIEAALEAYLVSDLPVVVKPPELQMPATYLEQFVGTYYPSSVRFGVHHWQQGKAKSGQVHRQGDRLVWRYRGRQIPLAAMDQNQFRRLEDPVATVVFIHDGPITYLQGELGHYVRTSRCPDFISAIPQCLAVALDTVNGATE